MIETRLLDGWETRFVAPWPAPHELRNISWEYEYPKRSESLPPNHWIAEHMAY